jgi:O-succinylbenzoate synthase
MIRIEKAELREIRLPLIEPFETSAGVTTEKRVLLLEMTHADGSVAWSECAAEALPTYSPDTVDTCWFALVEWVLPVVLRHEFEWASDVDVYFERRIRGHRMARATVEMGMWSIAALRLEVPLATLLARHAGASPRATVATGIAIGMQADPAALSARVAEAAREGYCRARIKIGPGRDVAFVSAVRDAAGQEFALAVDANCSYSLDDPSHLAALRELDTLGLAMIEQPLAHGDLVRHAELQRDMKTRICLDESLDSDTSAEAMLAIGSARMANLKPGRVGGFSEAIAIHNRCAAAGVPVFCGGMLETGIGRAYNVALASLPYFTEPGDLSPSSRYWVRDVVTSPWTMDAEGAVKVPLDKPGIGVDVDVGLIDDLTVRRVSLSRS